MHSWLCAHAGTLNTTSPALRVSAPCHPRILRRSSRDQGQQAIRCRCTLDAPAVRVGNGPVGRGLLSNGDLAPRTQLLSVPFDQLLMLSETTGGPFDSVHAKFAAAHAYIPDSLRRYIQGKLLKRGNPALQLLVHSVLKDVQARHDGI